MLLERKWDKESAEEEEAPILIEARSSITDWLIKFTGGMVKELEVAKDVELRFPNDAEVLTLLIVKLRGEGPDLLSPQQLDADGTRVEFSRRFIMKFAARKFVESERFRTNGRFRKRRKRRRRNMLREGKEARLAYVHKCTCN